MNRIKQIAQDERVRVALAWFEQELDTHVETIIGVQQIAAPTFFEGARADAIEQRFRALGLTDVGQDEMHNVYGRIAGTNPRATPVIVSAHSDTVFPAETDLTVRRNGRFVCGPGIGDNSTGVAGLFLLAEALLTQRLVTPADIWIVSNVGEEGLGDLGGMRAVVDRFGSEAVYIVVEGGSFGFITHEAVGVRRFRVTVSAEGGHSWGSFGHSSAIHVLGRMISAVGEIEVPANPKTTYNIGMIEGGTSINTIAQSAAMLVDLRSEDPTALKRLVKRVEAIIVEEQRLGRYAKSRYQVEMVQVGNRPAGKVPRETPVVLYAAQALHYVNCPRVTYLRGSTDSNIPLSRGIASVCVGLTVSANSHRLDEYIDPAYLPAGMSHLLLLVLMTAGF